MKDLHTRWPHRWITPKAKSFNSRIQGWGVLAIKPISKGEPIMVSGGVIVPTSEIKEYRKLLGHVGFQVDDDFFLVPTSREELRKTGIFNHSCNPNLGYESVIKLVAMRDIAAGEEIFLDYGFMESYFEPFECKCGSKDCRKEITPNDWKNTKLQQKHKQYFSPYLRQKII